MAALAAVPQPRHSAPSGWLPADVASPAPDNHLISLRFVRTPDAAGQPARRPLRCSDGAAHDAGHRSAAAWRCAAIAGPQSPNPGSLAGRSPRLPSIAPMGVHHGNDAHARDLTNLRLAGR